MARQSWHESRVKSLGGGPCARGEDTVGEGADLRIAAWRVGDFGWVRSFFGIEEEDKGEEEESAGAAGVQGGGAVQGLICSTC